MVSDGPFLPPSAHFFLLEELSIYVSELNLGLCFGDESTVNDLDSHRVSSDITG